LEKLLSKNQKKCQQLCWHFYALLRTNFN